VSIDIDKLAALGGQEDRQQRCPGLNPFKLAEKLTQRRILVATANERLKRMLVGIEAAEAFNPSQRGQNQGLKTTPKGRVAVMQQGKGLTRMGALMLTDGLFEPRHHRLKGIVLIEPAGTQMHPHQGQTRSNTDHGIARAHGAVCRRPKGAALATAQRPLGSPAVDLAPCHPRPNLLLGRFGEQVSAGAMEVLLEHGPQQSLLDFSEFATVTKRWTWRRSKSRLPQGDCHDFLLFSNRSGRSPHIRP